jgi:eukaryotic-like serine/threonine-protein kinase
MISESDDYRDPHFPATGELVLDRYEVLKQVGVGAHGLVYQVRDTVSGGTYALKLIDPLSSRRLLHRERFEREVRAMNRLSAPSTVGVIAQGWTATGCRALVMDFAPGRTLAAELCARLDAGATAPVFPDTELLPIARQLLQSLAEAHQQQIVHRDIKPANIMVDCHEQAQPGVRVLDLGFAFDLQKDSRMTATGEIACTPAYVAPERVEHGESTPASDVYALGITLLECIEGRLHWLSSDPYEVMRFHADQGRAIPMGRAARNSALAPVIERAIAKSLDVRYPDAVGMLHDVEAIARDTHLGRVTPNTGAFANADRAATGSSPAIPVVAAQAPPGSASAERAPSRRPIDVLSTAALLLALLAMAGWLYAVTRPSEAPTPALETSAADAPASISQGGGPPTPAASESQPPNAASLGRADSGATNQSDATAAPPDDTTQPDAVTPSPSDQRPANAPADRPPMRVVQADPQIDEPATGASTRVDSNSETDPGATAGVAEPIPSGAQTNVAPTVLLAPVEQIDRARQLTESRQRRLQEQGVEGTDSGTPSL